MAFSDRMPNAFAGRPLFLILLSISTMSAQFRQKPRVDLAGSEDLVIAPAEPHRCATCNRRSGVGVPSAARMAFLSSLRPRPSISISSSPVSPVSRPRNAFCRLSWKVRPIAITSPTDFIEVVSVVEAPGNFSNASAGSW